MCKQVHSDEFKRDGIEQGAMVSTTGVGLSPPPAPASGPVWLAVVLLVSLTRAVGVAVGCPWLRGASNQEHAAAMANARREHGDMNETPRARMNRTLADYKASSPRSTMVFREAGAFA